MEEAWRIVDPILDDVTPVFVMSLEAGGHRSQSESLLPEGG